jgi:hypothetical protein
MATGILLPALFTVATSEAIALEFGDTLSNPALQFPLGPWTPPQYSQPALTMLTVTSTVKGTTSSLNSGQSPTEIGDAITFSTGVQEQSQTQVVNYVFDAVFRVTHKRRIKKTSHPVLTGVNISDHAYSEPAQVSLEIGMSDSMTSYDQGIWVGGATKSISAWQVMKTLAINKTLFTLQTRLDTYINMLIVDLGAPDDNKTQHALRTTIVLEEQISASVYSAPSQSALTQTTDSTPKGVIQALAPNEEQITAHIVDPLTYSTIPGAGSISSNSVYNVDTGLGTP